MSLETSGIASQSAISAQLTMVQNSQPAAVPAQPQTTTETAAPSTDSSRGTTVDVIA